MYLDVTNTNNGKITWNYIKPIIGGKILYGPVNDQTDKIMMNANSTLLAVNRLKDLLKGADTIIKKLRVKGDFQNKFMNIVTLSKSPFVQMMLANFNVDSKVLDAIFDALLHDKQVSDIVETVANIFECFSVNRFVGVHSEKELEELAVKLNDQKLFYAGVYFTNDGDKDNQYAYEIRMDADNTPGTLDNRDKFWIPGPKGSFELQHRYHRGFIQLQHIMDQAIVKTIIDEENERLKEEWQRTTTTTAMPTTTELPETTTDTFEASTDPITAANTNHLKDNDEVLEFSSSTDNAASVPKPKLDHHHGVNLKTESKSTQEKKPANESNTVSSDNVMDGKDKKNPKQPEIAKEISEAVATEVNKSPDSLLMTAIRDDEPPIIKVVDDSTPDTDKAQPSKSILEKVVNANKQKTIDEDDPTPTTDKSGSQSLLMASLTDKMDKSEDMIGESLQPKNRRKRQFDFFGDLLGDSGTSKEDEFKGIPFGDIETFTKQFPYPKYHRDDFITGLYLAQVIQLLFFFALIGQVSNAVRNRIWMKESGNSAVCIN